MFIGNRTQVIWEKVTVGVKNILFSVNVLLKKKWGRRTLIQERRYYTRLRVFSENISVVYVKHSFVNTSNI